MTTGIRISGLKPCDCTDHVYVCLDVPGAPEPLAIKVEAGIGRDILAEINDIPTSSRSLVDIMTVTMRALGAEITGLTLESPSSAPAAARILMRSDEGRTRILRVPAGIGLLVASRVGCPLQLDEPREPARTRESAGEAADEPEVFRAFIRSLDMSDF